MVNVCLVFGLMEWAKHVTPKGQIYIQASGKETRRNFEYLDVDGRIILK
jgi:hypothetical protein